MVLGKELILFFFFFFCNFHLFFVIMVRAESLQDILHHSRRAWEREGSHVETERKNEGQTYSYIQCVTGPVHTKR